MWNRIKNAIGRKDSQRPHEVKFCWSEAEFRANHSEQFKQALKEKNLANSLSNLQSRAADLTKRGYKDSGLPPVLDYGTRFRIFVALHIGLFSIADLLQEIHKKIQAYETRIINRTPVKEEHHENKLTVIQAKMQNDITTIKDTLEKLNTFQRNPTPEYLQTLHANIEKLKAACIALGDIAHGNGLDQENTAFEICPRLMQHHANELHLFRRWGFPNWSSREKIKNELAFFNNNLKASLKNNSMNLTPRKGQYD